MRVWQLHTLAEYMFGKKVKKSGVGKIPENSHFLRRLAKRRIWVENVRHLTWLRFFEMKNEDQKFKLTETPLYCVWSLK